MSFEAPLVTELTALTDGQQNLNGSRAPGPWTSDAAGQYILLSTSVLPDPESGTFFNPWIRIRDTFFPDPVSGSRIPDLGSRIPDLGSQTHISESLVKIFGLYWVTVLRIHDILGWIRIRIRGSMPLTNGSGFGSGSFYFRH